MSSQQTIARRSLSRVRETWRSALSWTHWWLTRPQRALRRRQLQRRQEQLTLLRSSLLEALTPLAQALLRQDSLHREWHREQMQQGLLLISLLEEVLSSLQPSASQQLLPRLEQIPPSSPRRSVD